MGHVLILQSSSNIFTTSDLINGGIVLLSLIRWTFFPLVLALIISQAICVRRHLLSRFCHAGVQHPEGQTWSSRKNTAQLMCLCILVSHSLTIVRFVMKC